MSTHINTHEFMTFIKREIGSDKLARGNAQNFKIDNDEFDEANTNDNNYLEIDEILDDKDLYEQFATLFVEEKQKTESKDEDKEKEEKNKVKDKNGAGAA